MKYYYYLIFSEFVSYLLNSEMMAFISNLADLIALDMIHLVKKKQLILILHT